MSKALKELIIDLKRASDKSYALRAARYFKTGKGQYGENDKFIGINVPTQRAIANTHYMKISLNDLSELVSSPIHEYRLTAIIILDYKINNDISIIEAKDFFIKNIKFINNWDIVDSSASQIFGRYLFETFDSKKRINDTLLTMSKSSNLWIRRISIISTHYFIRNKNINPSLLIAKKLINDKEDLINKAVGWTLREVHKVDSNRAERFLTDNHKLMNRTTLRYAIERMNNKKKKYYLNLN